MGLSTKIFALFGVVSTCLLNVPIAIALRSLKFVVSFCQQSVKPVFRVLKRDFRLVLSIARVNRSLRKVARNEDTVASLFRKCAIENWRKTMFISSERSWSYGEAEQFTNRVANYFAGLGFKKGDTVSLVMENRPEHTLLWLGLSKIGVVTALINTNLKLKPLVHSIEISTSKAVIFSPNTAESISASIDELRQLCGKDLTLFCFGGCRLASELQADVIDSTKLASSSSDEPPSYRGRLDDKLIYLYTSGTTGLPKAAVIRHRRYLHMAIAVSLVLPIRKNDVIYHYLPLYHLAGSVLGCSQTILQGCTGVVVPKFSASRFWIDCKEHDVTVCQYIGEIARYLLMQPVAAEETQHKIRAMYGNGLRREIWKEFQSRFKIPHIYEIYGSTEGIATLVNIDNTVGAIGALPITLSYLGVRLPVTIIKVDPISGVPVRNNAGRCIECPPGEIGEIVAIIKDSLVSKFDGYVDDRATSKKIYRDCFKVGDRMFSSGDLAYRDRLGYVYFRDRTGDTFRWKGENVSTTEVESVLSNIINNPSIGSSVFGVEIPGTEGRAGMAVLIDSENKLKLGTLAERLCDSLPSYAVPIFVRVARGDDTTGTYKMSKTNFKRDSFDVDKCFPDPVFFFDAKQKRYIPLDAKLMHRIMRGTLRV